MSLDQIIKRGHLHDYGYDPRPTPAAEGEMCLFVTSHMVTLDFNSFADAQEFIDAVEAIKDGLNGR